MLIVSAAVKPPSSELLPPGGVRQLADLGGTPRFHRAATVHQVAAVLRKMPMVAKTVNMSEHYTECGKRTTDTNHITPVS